MVKSHSTSTPNSSTWGSNWTIVKLNAFKKYVEAYLTIMEVNKKKFDYYYFIDLNEELLRNLQEKISTFNLDFQLQFRPGDANKYLNVTEEDIKKEFYSENVNTTLLGEVTKIEKRRNSIRKITDSYIKRMNGIWKYVTQEPLIMKNTKNVEIIHFVFASNNQAGLRIAKDIIGRM